MSIVVPKQVQYERPSSLPAGTRSTQVVINPNNGSSFTGAGSIIQFDLLNKGYIVPSSMTLSYTINVVGNGAGNPAPACEMLGIPAVSPFQRLETIHNGNVIESVNNYNSLYNMLVTTKLNTAQREALATAFGTTGSVSGKAVANANAGAGGTTFSLAFPLGCLISNCDKLFPSAYVGTTRIQLTLDDVFNIFAKVGDAGAGAHNVVSYSLSNMTLKYDVVEFPPDIDAMILQSTADEMGNLHIKSQTFQTSSQTLPANASGQQSLIFNARLSSIKSLVTAFQGDGVEQRNAKFDAIDVSSKNGSYQYHLNGTYYPQRPLDTLNDFAGTYLELNSCWSQPHDLLSTNLSITEAEYSVAPATATTRIATGKHYVGVNTENMSGANGTLFSGVSSQGSPINLNVNLNANAGASARQVDLYACHDAIISVNVAMKELVVKT